MNTTDYLDYYENRDQDVELEWGLRGKTSTEREQEFLHQVTDGGDWLETLMNDKEMVEMLQLEEIKETKVNIKGKLHPKATILVNEKPMLINGARTWLDAYLSLPTVDEKEELLTMWKHIVWDACETGEPVEYRIPYAPKPDNGDAEETMQALEVWLKENKAIAAFLSAVNRR